MGLPRLTCRFLFVCPLPFIWVTLSFQEGGADVIELGVPFTDPQADGPTIQGTHQVCLSAVRRWWYGVLVLYSVTFLG